MPKELATIEASTSFSKVTISTTGQGMAYPTEVRSLSTVEYEEGTGATIQSIELYTEDSTGHSFDASNSVSLAGLTLDIEPQTYKELISRFHKKIGDLKDCQSSHFSVKEASTVIFYAMASVIELFYKSVYTRHRTDSEFRKAISDAIKPIGTNFSLAKMENVPLSGHINIIPHVGCQMISKDSRTEIMSVEAPFIVTK